MDTKELIKEQKELAEKVVLEDGFNEIEKVGGVDQAFHNGEVISSVVICDYDTLEIEETVHAVLEEDFPYIPGLLSYRESPSIMKALDKIELPDLLLFDGNGVLHMRRFGIASHVGVLMDVPTIGIAKSLLCGEVKEEGDRREVIYDEDLVGFEIETREGCNPVYVSPGHKVSFESSLEIVDNCVDKYKLPMPVQYAHRKAAEIKKQRSDQRVP